MEDWALETTAKGSQVKMQPGSLLILTLVWFCYWMPVSPPQISVILKNNNWHLTHIFLSTQRTKFWGFKDKKTCFLPTIGWENRTTAEQGRGPSWGWNYKSTLFPLAGQHGVLYQQLAAQDKYQMKGITTHIHVGKRSQEACRKLCWRVF